MCGCSHSLIFVHLHQADLLVVEGSNHRCLSRSEGYRAGRRFPTFQASSFPRKPLYSLFFSRFWYPVLSSKESVSFPAVQLHIWLFLPSLTFAPPARLDFTSCVYSLHFLCLFPSPYRRVTLACKHILKLSSSFSLLPVHSIFSLMCVLQRVEVTHSLWAVRFTLVLLPV